MVLLATAMPAAFAGTRHPQPRCRLQARAASVCHDEQSAEHDAWKRRPRELCCASQRDKEREPQAARTARSFPLPGPGQSTHELLKPLMPCCVGMFAGPCMRMHGAFAAFACGRMGLWCCNPRLSSSLRHRPGCGRDLCCLRSIHGCG